MAGACCAAAARAARGLFSFLFPVNPGMEAEHMQRKKPFLLFSREVATPSIPSLPPPSVSGLLHEALLAGAGSGQSALPPGKPGLAVAESCCCLLAAWKLRANAAHGSQSPWLRVPRCKTWAGLQVKLALALPSRFTLRTNGFFQSPGQEPSTFQHQLEISLKKSLARSQPAPTAALAAACLRGVPGGG